MMEKADNTIPSREELAAYIEESAVSVTNTYEQSPMGLMGDDAIIGTLGNFSASIGKAKSKKTFNVSAIVASALSGNTVLHYRSMFPENKRKILYIDTEQGQHHCQQQDAHQNIFSFIVVDFEAIACDRADQQRNYRDDNGISEGIKHRTSEILRRDQSLEIFQKMGSRQ